MQRNDPALSRRTPVSAHGGSLLRGVAVAAAVSAGLLLGVAAPANASTPGVSNCHEGARLIENVTAEEVQTVYTDGTRGRAQITLRRDRASDCFWGLLEGQGVIWLERSSFSGTDPNPEFNLYQRRNDENDITHTAPTITSDQMVRACGRAQDGSSSRNWNLGASGGASGTTPSGSVSIGIGWTEARQFADGTVCTVWAYPRDFA